MHQTWNQKQGHLNSMRNEDDHTKIPCRQQFGNKSTALYSKHSEMIKIVPRRRLESKDTRPLPSALTFLTPIRMNRMTLQALKHRTY